MSTWGSVSLTLVFSIGCGALFEGCGSDSKPGCVISQSLVLPPSGLTALSQVRLERVGATLGLIGSEANTVRFAGLTDKGEVTNETALTIPAHDFGPWYGLAGKNTPGDQIIVVYGVKATGSAGATRGELYAIVQNASSANPSTPSKIVDLPDGMDLGSFRAAMATIKSGKRSVFAYGFVGQKLSPEIVILGADGIPVGLPSRIAQLPNEWNSLYIVPSRNLEFGVAVANTGDKSVLRWGVSEAEENGNVATAFDVSLESEPGERPVIAPSPRGYAIAWITEDGTFFAEYNTKYNTAAPELTAGAVRFGGPSKQPLVVGICGVGNDTAMIYERRSGPEVWRLDVFARVKGSPLRLPSSGLIGPVSVLPGSDLFLATYLDGKTATPDAGAGIRRLVAVQCPADVFTGDSGSQSDSKGQDDAGGQ